MRLRFRRRLQVKKGKIKAVCSRRDLSFSLHWRFFFVRSFASVRSPPNALDSPVCGQMKKRIAVYRERKTRFSLFSKCAKLALLQLAVQLAFVDDYAIGYLASTYSSLITLLIGRASELTFLFFSSLVRAQQQFHKTAALVKSKRISGLTSLQQEVSWSCERFTIRIFSSIR